MSPAIDTSEALSQRTMTERGIANGTNGSLKFEKQSLSQSAEGRHSQADTPRAHSNSESDPRPSKGEDGTNGQRKHDTTSAQHPVNGGYKINGTERDRGLGILVEHSPSNGDTPGHLSVVDVYNGPEVKAALADMSTDPSHQLPTDKERVMKLSPVKIQELTSSPESIPYRPVGSETNTGSRVVSDIVHGNAPLAQLEIPESILQSLSEKPSPAEALPKLRPTKEVLLGDASAPASPAFPRNALNSSLRNRPQPARTVSTPGFMRRQLPVTPGNDRLTQTWASRSKQDRPALDRDMKGHLIASPQIMESPKSSPLPSSIPLPPVSLPTYLQLELASGRPSPLYIHRDAANDFPYESSRVKIERLMNFIMLAPMLEQVLCFGSLACLDAWLYSFTIMPLRFIKAVYILGESWVMNLGAEIWFIWKFVMNGIGRVWRRRNHNVKEDQRGRPESESDATPHVPQGPSVGPDAAPRRKHRSSESRKHHHRRKKSMPSALLPDDKADILTGLLMIATCCVLMYFDASRMYHWIRGQAAIKLYVIYNVLEVSDRLLAAIGQDVLECLFSREALERRPDGRSKIIRPFWLFLVALVYTVSHALSLFYQVMTLNVAVNSYSNALITLLLSNQFVEIKSTVFRKFEKENLFQLTCADVVERFQLWLMLTIIASRNIVETGAFNFIGNLGLGSSFPGQSSTITNSTPLSTPPRTASSILPQAFTLFPSSILSSFNSVNSFIPTLAQVLGPFLVVLGSEMLVDWLKHAYINKFNNNRPAIYSHFLDVLAKDYYTNAFGEQNLTRRIGLPVIPLSCLFFRVSVQTYQMFLAALLPQHPSSTANGATSLTSIHNHYAPSPVPSAPPLTLATLLPASAAHVSAFFRTLLENAIPSPAQSVHIFTGILLLTGFIVLLILKLLLGMVLLAFARSRYRKMKARESERRQSSNHPGTESGAPRSRDFDVEGSQRVGGWGVVEVGDEKRRLIYADDPDGLRRVKEKEEKDKSKDGELNVDHVQRYEMIAKKIW
ncbi:Membrane protein/CMV receptor [Penicillium cf. griseofulvum]|uniref:Membrane protein/CMV receptor n=1 Tax=Penicillium cf. griseofulvum TaxID=2972120 RepID=A0A9W9M4J2_9EURO|nr:Membrane protein/CMV receptor [Penicillium cf. griseofulvum]KAJ5435167.1 Membrane protein/CMV receptor [Penicillium cf. griseofulvum]KAJ5452999.1 Membrane protein/CMV receptor [Penicillium cf. griseofulvum]